jgi:hypothetical protein
VTAEGKDERAGHGGYVSIAAIVVSLVVAHVQYAQWRTANQKVVIDLYDRRLKVYGQFDERHKRGFSVSPDPQDSIKRELDQKVADGPLKPTLADPGIDKNLADRARNKKISPDPDTRGRG